MKTKNGALVSVDAYTSNGSGFYGCTSVASVIGPACSGVSVAADGRTVTFTNASLGKSTFIPAPTLPATVTFSGTMTAKGF